MNDILVGRQQILDSKQNIYGYELLFRGNEFDLTVEESATHATNQIIADTLLEIGLNNIVGSALAFVNFTTQNLLKKTPLALPKDRIIIEVLENVTVDAALIAALKELSELGYTIALDDFVMTREFLPLLDIADIIKLDILAMPMKDTLAMIDRLKPYNVRLLAEKVETHEAFTALKAAGCELFQGFFFSKPKTVAGKRIGVNQAIAIKLIATINKPEVQIAELSQIISQDVGLTYKLLKYINSAFFSLPSQIESVRHAITYLGVPEVKRWVNILALTSMSDKPHILFQQMLIRAKMCELLSGQFNQNSENLFLTGMFSSLDSILDIPIDEALSKLTLSTEIEQAILHQSGIMGEILAYVIRYERWDLSSAILLQISPKIMRDVYLTSISWANSVLGNVTDRPDAT